MRKPAPTAEFPTAQIDKPVHAISATKVLTFDGEEGAARLSLTNK